jgi:hypothetical protein
MPLISNVNAYRNQVQFNINLMNMPLLSVRKVRLANGRKAIKEFGGTTKLALALGHASPSTLSQVFGPNPNRSPTEGLMRDIERVLGLASGTLDQPDSPTTEAQPLHLDAAISIVESASIVFATSSPNITPQLACKVIVALLDEASERNEMPSSSQIERLIRLAAT